jgi:hypothetical protein
MAPRSGVADGAKFAGGRWRQVGRWVDSIPDPRGVLVFGGEEGVRWVK